MVSSHPFKWRHFQAQIILLNVRWYCRYPLSYRNLEEMMRERGLNVANWSPILTHFSEAGLKLTLFLIGTGLSIQALKVVGWQAIAQGIVLWIMMSISSLGFILWMLH